MSTLVDLVPLIPGATLVGTRGLGVLGSTIKLTAPTSVMFDKVLAGDEAKEFRAYVATPPVGDFYMAEDGTFTYSGAAGTFQWELFVDGVSQGMQLSSTGAAGPVTLAGVAQLTLTGAAQITVGAVPTAVQLAGSAALAFTATGAMVVSTPGAVLLAGAAALAFTGAGQITVDAPPPAVYLAGAALMTLRGTGLLEVGEIPPGVELAGAAAITLRGTGALVIGPVPSVPGVELAGEAVLTFTAAGALSVLAGPVAPLVGFSSELRTMRVQGDEVALQGKYTKQPSERLDYRLDLSYWMQDCGDTAQAATFESDTALTFSNLQVLAHDVVVLISGGVDGQKAKVTCTITTAGGRTKEVEFSLRIKEG